jgi:hypothetical protein
MPTPPYGLSSPKNAPLTQRFAGLPERFAARRAFGSQKSKNASKFHAISHGKGMLPICDHGKGF